MSAEGWERENKIGDFMEGEVFRFSAGSADWRMCLPQSVLKLFNRHRKLTIRYYGLEQPCSSNDV